MSAERGTRAEPRLVARAPVELADGEASRSFLLYNPAMSATRARAVALHRRRKARLEEALALGRRARADTARPPREHVPEASSQSASPTHSAAPLGAGSGRAAPVVDASDPPFVIDDASAAQGFRRVGLRWPLRPGGGRPELVGGALEGLALPDAGRWADLAGILAGVARPVGGGAPLIALDTETTGVGQDSGTIAFLIGAAYFDGDALVVEQWTLLRLSAEGAMLRDLAVRLDALAGPGTTLVTFNGASFDLPLLRRRLRRYGVIATHLAATHIDLLLPARRLWRELEPDCRLGTLERSRLGVSRQGDVAGSEIPQAYWRWLEDPAEPRRSALIERVHVHNVVDLLTLPALAEVIAAAIEAPATLAEALRVARLEVARGEDRRALAALEGWLPAADGALAGGAEEGGSRAVQAEDGALAGEPLRTQEDRGDRSRRGGVQGGSLAAEPSGNAAQRHALGGVRERMARLGVGAPLGVREVARIRRASEGERGPRGTAAPRTLGSRGSWSGPDGESEASRTRSRSPSAARGHETRPLHVSPPPRSVRASQVVGSAPLSTLERQAWGLAAGLLRRLGEDARSAALWAQICRRSPGDPEAHEALAKLLEHRLGDLPRALAVTRASSAPCPRRLARLRRKIAKHSHREPESVYG